MDETSEREALARLIAFAGRSSYDQARDATHYWENLAPIHREEAYAQADAVLAAGYHRGPRIPEPGTAEWEAMVERGCAGIVAFAVEAGARPDEIDDGTRAIFSELATRALRAALTPNAEEANDAE